MKGVFVVVLGSAILELGGAFLAGLPSLTPKTSEPKFPSADTRSVRVAVPLFAVQEESRSSTMTITPPKDDERIDVSFSHIQIYVDHLEELAVYQDFQNLLNQWESQHHGQNQEAAQAAWRSLYPEATNTETYVPQNRDLVKQLLACGFRVTGHCENTESTNLLVTSRDALGVQFVLSAIRQSESFVNAAAGDNPAFSGKQQQSGLDQEEHASVFPSHSTVSPLFSGGPPRFLCCQCRSSWNRCLGFSLTRRGKNSRKVYGKASSFGGTIVLYHGNRDFGSVRVLRQLAPT